MHGRIKVKTTLEKEREKALERKKKLQAFQGLTAVILKDRAEGRLDEALLHKTRDILSANPDFYTLWNIRREIFLKLKQEDVQSTEDLFKNELDFVVECLKVNPKSYGAWQQRCFVQLNMQQPNWSHELLLCSQFLEIDDRNFHCWDYRRFVVQHSGIAASVELTFTTSKIQADFSNFSSWHYRSSLLERMCVEGDVGRDGGQGGDEETRCGRLGGLHEEQLEKELSLVENALFTDPSDQSAWFYHGWLLSDKSKNFRVEGVVVDVEDAVVCLWLDRHAKIGKDICIRMYADKHASMPLQCKPLNEASYSRTFMANYTLGQENNANTIREITIVVEGGRVMGGVQRWVVDVSAGGVVVCTEQPAKK